MHGQGACVVGGGACVAGGHARPGGEWWGAMHGRGHAWWGGMLGRGHACHTCPPGHYKIGSVNARAVGILLECILVK